MKKLRKKIERIYHHFVKRVFSILNKHIKEELFFFESFHGKQYSDNPRAIYEYINQNYPKYKCVWAVKKGFEEHFIENDVPYVRRMGIKWLLIMPRAKFWFCNTRLPSWMVKGDNIYVQTWHGTPLKQLGLDIKNVTMPGTNTDKYKKNFKQEALRWDVLISPNTYSSRIFRRAFAYEGDILECGYPRNDILTLTDTKNKAERIKKKLGISGNKKIILYAPTWRDDHYYKKGEYKFDNHFPFNEVLDLDENVTILVRLHYLVADNVQSKNYNNRVMDVSNYEDISHLYMIADILVTDYSSVMFDYALTEKPMIFFMYDFDLYSQETRGLYLEPFEKLPGYIAKDEHALLCEIKRIIKEDSYLSTQYKFFIKEYGLISNEGSSKKVCDYLEIH